MIKKIRLDDLPRPPKQTCRGCGENPAVGIMFALCDPCFELFEAKMIAGRGPDGKYQLSDKELELMNDGPWVERRN